MIRYTSVLKEDVCGKCRTVPGTYRDMIDFEEELAKFRPSREVEQVEDAIGELSLKDMTDIMREILSGGKRENNGVL